MFKKIFSLLSIFVLIYVINLFPYNFIIDKVYSYNIWWTNYCFPTWDGDWILNSQLDWNPCRYPSGWYKVFGDIHVWTNGDFTINIPANTTLWIDLSNKKITFKDPFWNIKWKIILDSTAKIDNSVNNRYYVAVNYSNNWITRCPSWTVVMNLSRNWVLTRWQIENVSSVGTMYCARIWPNSTIYSCGYENGAIVCDRR